MKRKAGATLQDAQRLARAARWDGAANRAYYAVYQALVGEFEKRGLRAAQFAPGDPRYPEKWPHWLVVATCRAVGLSSREAELVSTAERLRVRADYEEGAVNSVDVQDVLTRIPSLFDGLGVRRGSEGDAS